MTTSLVHTRAKLRSIASDDLADVVALYRELAGNTTTVVNDKAAFISLLAHPGTSIHGAEIDGAIRSIATLHVMPNLTNNGRSYALIENVVTAKGWRGAGLGRAVMEHAIARAWGAECYKVMLMTGLDVGAVGFYEKLGFRSDQKLGLQLRRAPVRKPS